MINVTYFDEWCAKVWHMGIMHYEYSHREFHSKFTETSSQLYTTRHFKLEDLSFTQDIELKRSVCLPKQIRDEWTLTYIYFWKVTKPVGHLINWFDFFLFNSQLREHTSVCISICDLVKSRMLSGSTQWSDFDFITRTIYHRSLKLWKNI